MKEIDDKFYVGYEGEQEIQFITEKKILSIWSGYFDDIMEQFTPSEDGWTGLAYYYHLLLGWCEESPWKISDAEDCLKQFRSLDVSNNQLRFGESKEVLDAICHMLEDAVKGHEDVWISED